MINKNWDKHNVNDIMKSCIYHAPLIQNIHDVLYQLGYQDLPQLNDSIWDYYKSFIMHHWLKLLPINILTLLAIYFVIYMIRRKIKK